MLLMKQLNKPQVVDTYVPISQATANSSIATWVPNTYGSNSSEGTWVGNYFYNSNTGSYEYSNTRLYNTTTSTKKRCILIK